MKCFFHGDYVFHEILITNWVIIRVHFCFHRLNNQNRCFDCKYVFEDQICNLPKIKKCFFVFLLGGGKIHQPTKTSSGRNSKRIWNFVNFKSSQYCLIHWPFPDSNQWCNCYEAVSRLFTFHEKVTNFVPLFAVQ